MRAQRVILRLTATLGLAACSNPFVSYCGEETREVAVSARFPEASNANNGYVQVDFMEQHVAPERQVWWVFFSPELKGHITRAVIFDRSTSAELWSLPIQTGANDEALQGNPAAYGGTTPFNDLFTLAVSNRLSLRLTTDVPGRESLTQPLQRSIYHDWSRARCD